MSRKGHYSGGSTIISPRNSSWFKEGSTRVPLNEGVPKRRPSLTEKAFNAPKNSPEVEARFTPNKKRKVRKPKPAKRKPSIIKAEPSVPQKGNAVIHQALKGGRSREVGVEFVSDRKSKR